MQLQSILFVVLLAIFVDAERVFRAGNTMVPVTGTEAKEKDFGPLVNGKFQPGFPGGLSTNVNASLLPGMPTRNVWRFLADGSDVGGKAGKGHRSIAILQAIEPKPLLNKLNALQWTKES
ncbi:hypothetical protein BD410DRAFT_809608 [Rickenella mellea]|uniref:Secreted protein n=1 Tax=Rickenella mellea TaxID=50990 RepID=A0A4Y7PGU6_9AGAM|nr:hypothetical protein BD410DRAFT_809608 [Rickenella mellea]